MLDGSHFSDGLSSLSQISFITLAIPAQTNPLSSIVWLNDSIDLNRTQYCSFSIVQDLKIPAFSISFKAQVNEAFSSASLSETRIASFLFFLILNTVFVLNYSKTSLYASITFTSIRCIKNKKMQILN